ncbi:MAG TPA: response regulator transcription factor [Phototrophicaceae bacterium]|nr:response regulator transcription factor [Phototrophicaceae bacterium]
MSKRLLIVDDDVLLCRSVAFNLQKAGYTPFIVNSAEDALAVAQDRHPDAILLDIGLPGMDGLQALRLFQQQIAAPVIFVTARRRELDEVLGLEMGADDYITKPFDTDVLLARIKVALRHQATQPAPTSRQPIVVGNLQIDPGAHIVQIDSREIKMSPKEFDLLLALANEQGHVLTIDELLTRVWGVDWDGAVQTLYVHIRWLREKLELDPAHPHRLITVKGTGYKLVSVVE